MERDMSVEEKSETMLLSRPEAVQVDEFDCFVPSQKQKPRVVAAGVSVHGQPFVVKEIDSERFDWINGCYAYMDGKPAFSTDSKGFLDGWLAAQEKYQALSGMECPRRIEEVVDVDHE